MKRENSIFHTKMHIDLRPIHHVYIIPWGSEEFFSRAVTHCCSQWGGICNLIIPFDENGMTSRFFSEMITAGPSDVIVSYLPQRLNEVIRGQLRSVLPFREFTIENGETWDRGEDSLGILFPFRNNPQPPLITEYLSVDAGFDRTGFHAVFGCIPESISSGIGHIVPVQKNHMNPISSEIERFINEQAGLYNSHSLLSYSAEQVQARESTSSILANRAELVVARTVTGLCAFWNLRAIRRAMQHEPDCALPLLVPISIAGDSLTWQSIGNAINQVTWDPYFKSDLTVTLWAESDEDVMLCERAIKECEEFSKFDKNSPTATLTGDRLSYIPTPAISPIKYLWMWPPAPISFKFGAGPKTMAEKVSLEIGYNEILVQRPDKLPIDVSGRCVVSVRSDFWKRVPNSDSVAKTFTADGWFSHGVFNAMTSMNDSYTKIALSNDLELLGAYFRSYNYTSRHSIAGQYATALKRKIGDDGVNIMRYRRALSILQSLATKSSKKVVQNVSKRLQGLDSEALEAALADLSITPELRQMTASATELSSAMKCSCKEIIAILGQLSDKSIVRRGFRIECPNCATPHWYALGEASEILECPGCAYSFPLPVERSRGSELPFHYTLNSLVNRVIDHDAIVPIFAVDAILAGKCDVASFVGIELTRDGDTNTAMEFDFIYVENGRISGGECKANSGFQDKDFALPEKALNLGFENFWFVSLEPMRIESEKRIAEIEREYRRKGLCIKTLFGDQLIRSESTPVAP